MSCRSCFASPRPWPTPTLAAYDTCRKVGSATARQHRRSRRPRRRGYWPDRLHRERTTRHRPPIARNGPFDHAEPGSVGLETALAVALTQEIDIAGKVLRAMSWRPAELLGLGSPSARTITPGAIADLTIIDPNERFSCVHKNTSHRRYEQRIRRR